MFSRWHDELEPWDAERKENLVFKKCPKCNSTGRVSLDGKEAFREAGGMVDFTDI